MTEPVVPSMFTSEERAQAVRAAIRDGRDGVRPGYLETNRKLADRGSVLGPLGLLEGA